MPLHLLGKKSWNVYNVDNIARVRQDEAAAKAREEEEERRMQEVDAERRIQLSRGSAVASRAQLEDQQESTKYELEARQTRKRRRRAGEDDTERDIRLAREDADDVVQAERVRAITLHKSAYHAPLVDQDGHISLFPEERSRPRSGKNPEAEAEAAKKKREFEDQYTMRFSNAAGYKQGMTKPWYASTEQNGPAETGHVERDMWGSGEHRRQERQKAKLQDDDPLFSMRRGVQELKQIEKERKSWIESREREMQDLEKLERRSSRRSSKRHREHQDEDIETLDLDAWADPKTSRHRSPEDDIRYRSGRRHRHDRDRTKHTDKSKHVSRDRIAYPHGDGHRSIRIR